MGKSSMPTIDLERLKAHAGKVRGLVGNPQNFLGARRLMQPQQAQLEQWKLLFSPAPLDVNGTEELSGIALDYQFNRAVDCLAEGSESLSAIASALACDVSEIEARNDRIERMTTENADQLRTLIEGI